MWRYRPGRLPELTDIIAKITAKFSPQLLKNKNILITAGPTHEAIDPVRYLANRSSGKMGYALAEAAVNAGACVTLISGPTALTPPLKVKFIAITSAQEMYDEVMNQLNPKNQQNRSNSPGPYHIFIGAAAVSDFRPETASKHKIKKQKIDQNSAGYWSLNLAPNKDIVAAVALLDFKPFVVGFAAETENLMENSRGKLLNKQLDMVIANYVGDNQGFGLDQNAVTVIDKKGNKKEFNETSKRDLAKNLISLIQEYYED